MNLSCAVSLQSPETPLENRHDVSLNMKSVLGTMSEPVVIKPYLPSGSLPFIFRFSSVYLWGLKRKALHTVKEFGLPTKK